MSGTKKSVWLNKECVVCGKEFSVVKSHNFRQACSEPCGNTLIGLKQRGKRKAWDSNSTKGRRAMKDEREKVGAHRVMLILVDEPDQML